ncbi:hypothetical protein L208DRAFT_1494861 [Tricholoma matsutake]|nr:hypothetical protein L208DRAFT_1494861 [Tricholoma matsutake 945]
MKKEALGRILTSKLYFIPIFIVKDEHNDQRDKMIARHVMNIHMNRGGHENDAQEMLSSHFMSLRKQVQEVERDKDERDRDERSSIPLTVRQLEAIIRISESLALSPVVQNHHVEEAIRLFKPGRVAQSDRASDFYGGPGDLIVNNLKAASSTLANMSLHSTLQPVAIHSNVEDDPSVLWASACRPLSVTPGWRGNFDTPDPKGRPTRRFPDASVLFGGDHQEPD